jgi:hypothetical protein
MKVRLHTFYRGPGRLCDYIFVSPTPPPLDSELYWVLAVRELKKENYDDDNPDGWTRLYSYVRRAKQKLDGRREIPLLPNSVQVCFSSLYDPHATRFADSDGPAVEYNWDVRFLQRSHERFILFQRGKDWDCLPALEHELLADTPRESELRAEHEKETTKLTNELSYLRRENTRLRLRFYHRFDRWWFGGGVNARSYKTKRWFNRWIKNPIVKHFR